MPRLASMQTPGTVHSIGRRVANPLYCLQRLTHRPQLSDYVTSYGGAQCPFEKNCSTGPKGPCEHFVLTGADLAYWERKRDAAYHFAEGAPNDEARDYILSQWHPWEPALTGLREALDELGLLEQAEELDLRAPRQDYFDPLFSTGFQVSQLNPTPPLARADRL